MGVLRRMLLAALPLLCTLSCGGPESASVTLDLSLAETEVSSEAGQVFVRVASDVSWTLAFAEDVDWASLSAVDGTGNRNSIILSYSMNEGSGPRSLTVVATAVGGKVSSSATLVQTPYSAIADDHAGPVDGGKASSTSLSWLELPATDDTDGKDFIWHNIKVGGKSIRNYSYYWDYSSLVASWVAYPLTADYINRKAGSMPYRWGLEPLLSASEQPVLIYGYGATNNNALSGAFYARGHQLAMADRKITDEANIQTCYGTNMTPQLNKSDYDGGAYDFNGGIWVSLENRVRNWAENSDTLYVVTGCTVEGSKYWSTDNYGKRVTVPTGYFKAVLRYSSSTTLGLNGYMGCAVYLEHKLYPSSSKVTKDYSMSIDKLEEKLGYDLFVNLPGRVGADVAARIEADDPQRNSWWWN